MLKHKLWRDLFKNKMQFISIFLMSFLGLFVFVGLDAEGNGLGVSAESYYEETNLADYWVAGKSFTSEDVKQVEKLNGVNQVERRLQLNASADLEGDPYLQLNFLEENEISKLYLKAGEAFQAQTEGIWLDELFAKGQNLNIGDTLTIEFSGIKMTQVIKGLIIHPEYVYYLSDEGGLMPEYGSYGYGFLSMEEFPIKEQVAYNQLLIDVDGMQRVTRMKDMVMNALDSKKLIVMDRTQNLSYQTFDAEKEQHIMMGFLFPVVFLLIAILGIVTTMTRMTSNQRVQIGTLKALGFTKNKITIHYMSYGFVISLVGSFVGAYVGFSYLPLLFRENMKLVYIVPRMVNHISANSYYAIIINIGISTVVSYLACRKELKDPPGITLKPAVPKKSKPTWIEMSKLWEKMSFSTKWNYRDMIRNKMRTLMGIVGVVGCTMLLVCAFGTKDSVADMSDWMYQKVMTCKNKILFSENAMEATKLDYQKKYQGQLIQESAIEITANDKMKSASITVLDEGNFVHFQDVVMNSLQLSKNGVALSYKMAQNLGVKKGDFIEWHLVGSDNWVTTRVEQLYRTPVNQGIAMNRETFEAFQYTFGPTALLTNVSPPDALTEHDEIQGVQDITQMEQAMEESMEMMNTMIGILVFAAVTLGIIVLYNLGVLTFVEKTREIATLKVLGFSSHKIRRILQMQNIWVTLIGICIGLPAGYEFLVILLTTLSESQDVLPVVTFLSYLYSIGGTFLVSLLVNKLLSGKVKTIDMVDALKGVE